MSELDLDERFMLGLLCGFMLGAVIGFCIALVM